MKFQMNAMVVLNSLLAGALKDMLRLQMRTSLFIRGKWKKFHLTAMMNQLKKHKML